MDALQQARDAASRGEPEAALDLLLEAEASAPLDVGALGLLADVAYATGNVEVTFEAWERAHTLGVHAGDDLSAAAAAARIAMHLLMDTGLLAPVRVWIKRAEHLLEGQGPCAVEAVLAVAHGYERLLFGDFPAARRWARRAIEVGREQGVLAPVALGMVMEARSVMFTDNVQQGLDLLDEAAAVAVSDELDPLSAGLVYCELVCAWQGLAQYDRAEELTAVMERWCQQHHNLGSVHGRCRVHRAEMLRLRGALGDAEEEAFHACDELRPFLRREFGWPLTELGLIRLQRGDLNGADEAFVQAHRAGWDPHPGLALLHLERGDLDAAVATINDALDHPLGVPSKELPPNTELRRAPLLAAQVEISVAAGLPAQARSATDELEKIASAFTSRALQASAAHSHATVELAAGDVPVARRAFKRAVDTYTELAMPYEAARSRVGLAQTYQAQGEGELARLEFRAAASIFGRIGADRPATRAADAADRLDEQPGTSSEPASQVPPAAGEAGGIRVRGRATVNQLRAEGDYWVLIFAEQTVRIRDLKGLRYLARMLVQPGREFHVIDLVAAEHGTTAVPVRDREPGLRRAEGGSLGALLDAQAKAAYRRRLAEIEEDQDEARTCGDDERVAKATVERDFLLQELSRAVGLGDRDRPTGAASERARVSVTRTIRYTLDRIRKLHPPLGAHLDHAVRTGSYVTYKPDPRAPVHWEVHDAHLTPRP